MAAVTTFTRASATATGEWSRRGEHSSWAAWARDIADAGTVPVGWKRPVVFYKHGGAQTNWEDIELGINSSSPYYSLVNDFFAVLISYDTSPGWVRTPNNESTSSRDVFVKQFEDATAISYFKSVMSSTGPLNPLPSGMTITTDPNFCVHGGSSSGGYDVLRTQLMPDGTVPYGRGGLISGNARYGRKYNHLCNVLLCNIAQTTLSQFQESVDPSGTGDVSTYTLNSSASSGATTLSVTGDNLGLLRGNRLYITTDTNLVVNGNQLTGTESLSVRGTGAGSASIKRATYAVITVGGTTYTALVNSDIAALGNGVTGTLDLRLWTPVSAVTISDGTTIKIKQEFAVTEDMNVSGSAPYTLKVFPGAKTTLASTSVLELLHEAPEAYGELSWAHQYLFSSQSGWKWRSDAADGYGFPLVDKIQADIDPMLTLDNPRVFEIKPMFTGADGTSLAQCVLTGDDSFYAMYTPGSIAPWYIDLHDQYQAWYVAHWLYNVAGNTNVQAYIGGQRSNPAAGTSTLAWNKGRNTQFTADVFNAYLQSLGWTVIARTAATSSGFSATASASIN